MRSEFAASESIGCDIGRDVDPCVSTLECENRDTLNGGCIDLYYNQNDLESGLRHTSSLARASSPAFKEFGMSRSSQPLGSIREHDKKNQYGDGQGASNTDAVISRASSTSSMITRSASSEMAASLDQLALALPCKDNRIDTNCNQDDSDLCASSTQTAALILQTRRSSLLRFCSSLSRSSSLVLKESRGGCSYPQAPPGSNSENDNTKHYGDGTGSSNAEFSDVITRTSSSSSMITRSASSEMAASLDQLAHAPSCKDSSIDKHPNPNHSNSGLCASSTQTSDATLQTRRSSLGHKASSPRPVFKESGGTRSSRQPHGSNRGDDRPKLYSDISDPSNSKFGAVISRTSSSSSMITRLLSSEKVPYARRIRPKHSTGNFVGTETQEPKKAQGSRVSSFPSYRGSTQNRPKPSQTEQQLFLDRRAALYCKPAKPKANSRWAAQSSADGRPPTISRASSNYNHKA